jgi:hypothetical protein
MFDESLTYNSLNSNPGSFWWFYFYLCKVENRVCLSRGVQMIGTTWRAVTRIVTRVGGLLQRTEDDQAHVGYSVAGRMRGQVTLCVVCTIYKKTTSVSFLVLTQYQGRWFVNGLTSKPPGQFVSSLSSKPLGRFVSGLTSKPLG